MRLSPLLALASVSSVHGFAVVPAVSSSFHRSRAPLLQMSDMGDAPSDTTSDDDEVFTVTAVTVDSTESESLVNSILDQLPTRMGDDISDEIRTAINEATLKLEAMNPTESPTMSPLLNGVWELRYAAGYSTEWAFPSPTRQIALFLYSGGYSPGLFALLLAKQLPAALVDVGELEISISRQQPRIEATVPVQLLNGSLENQVSVRARLDVESEVRMRETYESATVLDQNVDFPSQFQYSRDLYVTYVDEDLLVVRDASGVPEILVRKQKQFSQNWGTEPEALGDDMVPPGEDLPATD